MGRGGNSVVSARVCGSRLLVEFPTSREIGSLGRERSARGGER